MHVCVQCGKEYATGEVPTCTECAGPIVVVRATGETLVGREFGEKYLLLEQLGEGGMGAVFRAKQRHLDSFVAVKVLRLTLADRTEALQRFYSEAKNSSKLTHPHNVRVFDFGHTEDGLVYIVMEQVQGKSLSRLVRPVPLDRALLIMVQVCGALTEAHESGLIHRDLKPENIMVSHVDGRDFARVLDYGIAKFENSSTGLTADGRIIGTPEYLSPEQVSGKKLDRRSDIYALGLILYDMLAGRPPFQSDNPLTLAYLHINEEPPPPSSFAPIPEDIEELILQCLDKDRNKRPQSAPELRAILEEMYETVKEPSGVFYKPPLGLDTVDVERADTLDDSARPSTEPPIASASDEQKPAPVGKANRNKGTVSLEGALGSQGPQKEQIVVGNADVNRGTVSLAGTVNSAPLHELKDTGRIEFGENNRSKVVAIGAIAVILAVVALYVFVLKPDGNTAGTQEVVGSSNTLVADDELAAALGEAEEDPGPTVETAELAADVPVEGAEAGTGESADTPSAELTTVSVPESESTEEDGAPTETTELTEPNADAEGEPEEEAAIVAAEESERSSRRDRERRESRSRDDDEEEEAEEEEEETVDRLEEIRRRAQGLVEP